MVNKSIKSLCRTTVLWAALAATANGQTRVGDAPNGSDKAYSAPVQTYAVIDVSGSDATSPVTLVALDDSNQMAFGFETGDVIDSLDFHSQYQVGIWQAGNVGLLAPVEIAQDGGDADGVQHWKLTSIDCLTPSGNIYGNTYSVYIDDEMTWPDGVPQMFGCIDLPNPPYELGSNYLADASDLGYIAGDGDSHYATTTSGYPVIYSFIKEPNDQFTLFSLGTYDAGPVAGVVTVPGDKFSPTRINNYGKAFGSLTTSSSYGYAYWDGSQATFFTQGTPTDLNDQGQVVLQGIGGQGNTSEGGLWENGVSSTLVSKLPKILRGQLKDILPFSISNQVKPAPAADVDKTIHILATAKDNGVDVTVVCTRDNTGAWTFAEIQLPEGVTINDYTTINSSGVIAAIGNADTEDEHALLLVPYGITFGGSYHGVDDGDQGKGITGQNIVLDPTEGKIGAEVPSIFAKDHINHPHPEKHFVTTKSVLYGPAGAFAVFYSGLPASIADQFEWVPNQGIVTLGDASKSVLVKRDVPSKVRLQIRKKGSSTPGQETMNVWIVWDDIQFEPVEHKCTPKSPLKGKNGLTLTGTFIEDGYTAYHTILPSSILKDPDIPDLKGPNTVDVPGGELIHTMTGLPLSKGANSKWDPSQAKRTKILNPNAIPNDLISQPPAVPSSYPENALIGNDDCYTNTGQTNPYKYGVLSFFDAPGLGIADGGGKDGDTYEWRLQFKSFGRAQIGDTWYLISDPHLWRVHLKLKNSHGVWIDNMTPADKALNNDEW